ncbi:MAG: DUF2442 domain-containing protein [Deltaproteobacteria bacterium]|nr:DUF2442 domain-containing protein [Deltaproteobacteria bacterium]
MIPEVVEAVPLADYELRLRFADGVEGVVDLGDLVGQGVFAAWSDPAVFARVFVDRESRTVAWPGGIDLCPVALRSEVLGTK